jgi:hypothetical protein
VLLLDAVAHRYGRWPHEVEELTPYQLGLASLCIRIRREHEQQELRRLPTGVQVTWDLRG